MHCLFRYTQFTSGLAFIALNVQESLNFHNAAFSKHSQHTFRHWLN